MFKNIIDFILNLGPSVMLPIVMIIFGLLLKQGFSKSVRAGVTIGIGFVGVGLVIGLLTSSLGPAATSMVERFNLNLNILDVGWPVGAAISFGTSLAPVMIPIIVIFNIFLVAINFTKTINVDIWNFWHLIFSTSVAYIATDNVLLAIVIGLIITAITLKLADWTAPAVEHHFGLKGVSLAHSETVNIAPIAYALNKVQDKIPGLNKLHADPETLKNKFGIFGEPIAMGLILGIFIGILGQYDLQGTLTLGIQMAAVLILLPRMVSLIMEGLIPLSEGVRSYMSKRFPGKEVYIGLDAAVVIGNPANMAVALMMVPITILLAVILPWNEMLPFADLAVLPFTVIWAVAASRGNIIRGLINAIVTVMVVLWVATNIAGLVTTMGRGVGFDIPEGATLISGIDVGSHLLVFIIINLLDPAGPLFISALIFGIIYALLWFWVRNDIKKQYAKELGIEDQFPSKKSKEFKEVKSVNDKLV